MRELSLFTGMGGGIYGSLILGWKTVGYVEKEPYCQQVIAQRIKDGWFDKAPIYGDIKEFNEKHAHEYTNKIDVLTGGFPCQPFSLAGKRQGTSDERYLFDQIIKTIEIVRPRRCFFENVRGLLTDPAIINIYQQLAELGFTVKPALLLGSDDCGNIHRRKRVWILADNQKQCCNVSKPEPFEHKKQQKSQPRNCVEQFIVTDTKCSRRPEVLRSKKKSGGCSLCNDETETSDTRSCLQTANTVSERTQRIGQKQIQRKQILQRRENIRSREDLLERPDIPKPLLCRMDDELPHRSQRLKAVGNGQDPIVMATAYQLLTGEV